MGRDWDIQRHAVAVDAPELQFSALIPAPMGLTGNAETGVRENREKTPTRLQRRGHVPRQAVEIRDVVDGHQAHRRVVRSVRPGSWRCGIGDVGRYPCGSAET